MYKDTRMGKNLVWPEFWSRYPEKDKVIVSLIQVINASWVLPPYVLDFPGHSQIFCSVIVMSILAHIISYIPFNSEYMAMVLFLKYGCYIMGHSLKIMTLEYALL